MFSSEMAKVWNLESKFLMANERTLIAWLHLASTIGVGGLALVLTSTSRSGRPDHSYGWSCVQVLLAGLIVLYALFMYRHRIRLFEARNQVSFEERVGPSVVTGVSVALLLYNLQLLINQPDIGCLDLPLDIFHNTTPPYLYITFHGTLHPRRTCDEGVGGVHRFTLEGEYAGMATDQLAAQMMHPRGMVRRNEMLFVAESWTRDSSVAVFGACTGTTVRTYLGRIRPDPSMAFSFSHPYGMATTADNSLRVSTQNGAAVVAIDVHTNAMSIEHQVVAHPAKHARSSASGEVRGMAIDAAGCEHVANKQANKIVHYCPDLMEPTSTPVKDPVGVFYHAKYNMLLVSSLAGDGVVLAYDLKGGSAKSGNLPILRRFTANGANHFAGMYASSEHLYVLEQTQRALLRFELENEVNATVLIKGLPDIPEQIMLMEEC